LLSSLLCFLVLPLPPRSTLFPYTTLFRSHRIGFGVRVVDAIARGVPLKDAARILELIIAVAGVLARHLPLVIRARLVLVVGRLLDRKSTRLNSSHVSISYAVFCLKKKKKK